MSWGVKFFGRNAAKELDDNEKPSGPGSTVSVIPASVRRFGAGV